jgi:hypothetical protein
MFSYPNKVVAIKITGQAGSDSFDILVNSGYAGSITGTGQGDGGYFVASRDSSLSLTGLQYDIPTGYPSSVLFNSFDYYYDGNISGVAYRTVDPYSIYSGYYDLEIESGYSGTQLVHDGSSGFWSIISYGVTEEGTGTNPSNPYGTYGGFNIGGTIDISIDPSILINKTPVSYFSNLTLDTGTNQLCFINSLNNGSGNKLFYEIGLYELSGSFLANPSIIQTGQITPTTGASECLFFNLAYPTPNPPIVCPEFDPNFDVDTGNLNQIFTGSGVHLKKDVTFFFDILDQQLNPISSNQQFVENPLISGCVFDVLNIDGTTAVENFFTGKFARSVTVSALDNENIFGNYQKDFGVRCKMPNTFDGSIFTGVFLAYGNIPNILDIVPNYSEFNGAAQATESFSAAIVLQNDLKFTQMDRYDVYALTGSGSAVNELTFLNPTAQEGYLFSQSAINVSDTYNLTINKGQLEQDIPYYFTVVPYGALGSGRSFVFGTTTFVSAQTNITFPSADVSAVNIYYDNAFSRTEYKTGSFDSDQSILHEFSSGDFSSVKYFVELHGGGERLLSEPKGVVNTTGLYLIKEGVNDTTTNYQLVTFQYATGNMIGLYASGTGYSGYTYKLQATMI